ncbi:MAG TPA: outer membrane lipoprotein carrier protein LolA [Aliidongia sp.]|uniref:LolA family protein n=1 Tax=Aliidongia sp. TaxID=1914230 RepID=UPI002DDD2761|nr:outer membrane lipoprotein carrier protein LolA [Aliidongia sp.]HEV2677707.1 outer membrane lipoprotein carrier protein LolA [Aliidongia sp.]
MPTPRPLSRRALLRGAAFIALAVAIGPHLAFAAAPVAATLTAQDQADLKRVEVYLDGIKTMQALFQQTNPDGSTAEGELFMSRPGKLRFEYQPPVQMFIVSDGNYVAVDDLELKNVQFFPVESTPVWFLLREAIKLSGDVTVTRFERGPKSLRVTCVQTKDPGNGGITLVFQDDPLVLKQWIVLDPQHRVTTVALVDPRQGVPLKPEMFYLPTNTHDRG